MGLQPLPRFCRSDTRATSHERHHTSDITRATPHERHREERHREERTVRKPYKAKWRPTPHQEREREAILWRCRHLYHAALEQRVIAWQRVRRTVSRVEHEAELKDIRAAFPADAA